MHVYYFAGLSGALGFQYSLLTGPPSRRVHMRRKKVEGQAMLPGIFMFFIVSQSLSSETSRNVIIYWKLEEVGWVALQS